MPTATQVGRVRHAARLRCPARRTRDRALRSRGGMPSKMQSVSLACPSVISQGRDGGAGLFQSGLGLIHVELGHLVDADLELLLDEVQDLLLNLDVGAGNLDPLLGHPVLHVIRRHVGEQCHHGVIVVFDRSVEVGGGGFHIAAEASPEIEFPAQVETGKADRRRARRPGCRCYKARPPSAPGERGCRPRCARCALAWSTRLPRTRRVRFWSYA